MKASKAALRTWSKDYDSYLTYHLTVYGSDLVEFSYDSPHDSGILVARMSIEEFLMGRLDHRIVQYLGEPQLKQIRSFCQKRARK